MSPRHLAVTLLLSSSAWLAACSSTTSDTGTPTASSGGTGAEPAPASSCTPADAPLCEPARPVASAAAFLAEQKQLYWHAIASSKSGTLSVSADLIAEADLVIEATTLAVPPSCKPTDDAGTLPLDCSSVLFREDAYPRSNNTARVPGVSCGAARMQVRRGLGELCSTLTIARGTVFRMRNVTLDEHPSGYVNTVDIVPACTVPCASGEARCSTTQTCLPLGYATCAYCDGKSVSTCACTDACSARADGAACSYDSSPDTPVRGTCASGTCAASR